MVRRGRYYVEGVGYSTIVDVLTGQLTGVVWLWPCSCSNWR